MSIPFSDVRHTISSIISYEVEFSFTGLPQNIRLGAGKVPARMDFLVVFGLFKNHGG
jgi:hypothetical protein